MTSMRTSINVIPEGPIGEIVDLAVHAEELGFDRVWVYDEGLATRDVYVVMAAIAAATSRIQIGPGITNPYTRHPGQTAAAIASLDEFSGGRAFLGVGAGGSLTLDPLGLERTRPLGAVRDTIEVARALFGGGPVDHDGRTTLRSASLAYGRPDTEIWLAGRGPRMLAMGGELADGVMLDFIHKPDLADAVQRVRAGGGARVCYSTAVVTDADDLEFVRPHMTYRLVDSPPAVKAALGMTDEDTATIRAAMSGGLHAAAAHVPDAWVEPFILRGTGPQCGAELAQLVARHGIDEFLLPVQDLDTGAELIERLNPA